MGLALCVPSAWFKKMSLYDNRNRRAISGTYLRADRFDDDRPRSPIDPYTRTQSGGRYHEYGGYGMPKRVDKYDRYDNDKMSFDRFGSNMERLNSALRRERPMIDRADMDRLGLDYPSVDRINDRYSGSDRYLRQRYNGSDRPYSGSKIMISDRPKMMVKGDRDPQVISPDRKCR